FHRRHHQPRVRAGAARGRLPGPDGRCRRGRVGKNLRGSRLSRRPGCHLGGRREPAHRRGRDRRRYAGHGCLSPQGGPGG
ncbi:MAG: hypothetical protein ACFFA6_14900, partial [Promethearchaeota archaeon]